MVYRRCRDVVSAHRFEPDLRRCRRLEYSQRQRAVHGGRLSAGVRDSGRKHASRLGFCAVLHLQRSGLFVHWQRRQTPLGHFVGCGGQSRDRSSGGTNPASGQIVWSTPTSAFDTWASLGVDAINCNTTVTFFMYTTQSAGLFINAVYFDDASLSVTTQGTSTNATCGAVPGGTPGTSAPGVVATLAPPTQQFAPFVQKQAGEQPDGSIIHVVGAGDTLAAIGVAYHVTLDQLRQLNNIQPGNGFLKIGQKIIVRGPTPITPTGLPTLGAIALPPTVAPIALLPTTGAVAGAALPGANPVKGVGTLQTGVLNAASTFGRNSQWFALGLLLALIAKQY